MSEKDESRLDRVVEGLLKGRRLRLGPKDAPEREAVMIAAELSAAREGHPRMSPAFRRRLAGMLAGGDPAAISRRTALGAVAGLAAGVTGAFALGRLAAPPASPGLAGGVMKPGGGRWVPVAAFSELAEGVPMRVVAGDVIAFVFRQGSQVHALSGLCSHPGWPCALNWVSAEGGRLNCPCHNVQFTPDGRSAEVNYRTPPLPAIPVRVEGGQVLLWSQ